MKREESSSTEKKTGLTERQKRIMEENLRKDHDLMVALSKM